MRLWIPPDRFNVEGSGEGIAYYPDSHYIQWPELWKEHDFDHGRYLRSMTAKEELADFLIQRSECFYELGNGEECLKAIYYARALEPDDERYDRLHAKRSRKILAEEKHRDEMVQEINERNRKAIEAAERRKRLPHTVGHPQNCSCQSCEHMRDVAETMPMTPHGGSCQCRVSVVPSLGEFVLMNARLLV